MPEIIDHIQKRPVFVWRQCTGRFLFF